MASSKKGKDPRGGHVRLYWHVIDSNAWKALGYVEMSVWIAMRRQLTGSNNGNIDATLSTLRHHGFKSPTTIAKSVRALLAAGLIAWTRKTGGLTHQGKECCLYRFTDEASYSFPNKGVSASKATHDYQRFRTVAHATAEIDQAHTDAKRPDHPNSQKAKAEKGASKLHLMNNSSPLNEPFRFNPRTMPGYDSSLNELCHTADKSVASLVNAGSPTIFDGKKKSGRHGSESGHLYMLPSIGSARGARAWPRLPPTIFH
ncbi:hypothetical protein [Actimicrobium sp. CCI2.3]|uniref:hypothetical protein n=1 Tax=Actimicrobium sp. CCI2.3 TaxID=3048616 RepID=UPI002AB45657|nr:hypothetical protein [Actimicrobium sp. CCI2.3]MDY7576185.1 hypothetical protein [Actimicrobium sp. CCI2.3]MEB0020610.1 hypothetical protein [Actimicrobium sp. CCI2.3]